MRITESQLKKVIKRMISEAMDPDLASDIREPGMTMATFGDLKSMTIADKEADLLADVADAYLSAGGDIDGVSDALCMAIGRLMTQGSSARSLMNGLVSRGVDMRDAEGLIDACRQAYA